MATTKKKSAKRKPKPQALGSGMAYKAGKTLKGRAKQIKRQECRATGGKWKDGRCT
jgi:hypothetical protein